MKLGLIARADARGLGIQTKSVFDNLHPAKTMVVDCPSMKPLPLRRDWFPGATWVHGLPAAADFRIWLQGLDCVYTAETAYGPLWDEADRAGVRTVLAANYEFLEIRDRPTVWAMPSLWHFKDVPFTNKVHLPFPIDTSRFTVGELPDLARNFVHVVGRPAVFDRNGTEDLVGALRYITSDVTVTFRCQEPGYVEGHLNGAPVPPNIRVVIESGDVDDNVDLYRGQDVLVLPRRFGGLSLPLNEALGCGLPVIMPNIEPNSLWLPGDWLVDASKRCEFMVKTRIGVYSTPPQLLAQRIDQSATDAGFYEKAKREAAELREQLSWESLKPRYEEVLGG